MSDYMAQKMDEQIEGAQHDLAQMQADARRYRWLRDKAPFGRLGTPSVSVWSGEADGPDPTDIFGEALDAAIDAEMDREA